MNKYYLIDVNRKIKKINLTKEQLDKISYSISLKDALKILEG